LGGYESWLTTVPPEITTDTIWRTPAYRFSLFHMFRAQSDLQWIGRHRSTRALSDQLLRAVGGISANLDEGYSRSSGRERAHFYEYALGSTREARGWYYKMRGSPTGGNPDGEARTSDPDRPYPHGCRSARTRTRHHVACAAGWPVTNTAA